MTIRDFLVSKNFTYASIIFTFVAVLFNLLSAFALDWYCVEIAGFKTCSTIGDYQDSTEDDYQHVYGTLVTTMVFGLLLFMYEFTHHMFAVQFEHVLVAIVYALVIVVGIVPWSLFMSVTSDGRDTIDATAGSEWSWGIGYHFTWVSWLLYMPSLFRWTVSAMRGDDPAGLFGSGV